MVRKHSTLRGPSQTGVEIKFSTTEFVPGEFCRGRHPKGGNTLRLISARRSRPDEKNSSSTTSRKTTAANFEARFDAGRDVLDYFDPARAVLTHGGLRVGAGRKALGKLRKTVKLSPGAIRRFQAYAKRKRLPDFSAALEAASLKL